MDPKKMLITPEKTVEADEKKAAAEAAEAAEEAALQEHYEHAASLLSAAEEDPERLKALGKETGVDYSIIVEHATAMKAGNKMYAGKPLSEEEETEIAEKGSFLKKILGDKIRKDFQEASPEARARRVQQMKRMMQVKGWSLEKQENALKELNIIDSDAPSEADTDNDNDN